MKREPYQTKKEWKSENGRVWSLMWSHCVTHRINYADTTCIYCAALCIAFLPTHTHIETCKFSSSASVITSKIIIVIDTDCLRVALRADHCYSLRTTWFAAPGRPLAVSTEFVEEQRCVY